MALPPSLAGAQRRPKTRPDGLVPPTSTSITQGGPPPRPRLDGHLPTTSTAVAAHDAPRPRRGKTAFETIFGQNPDLGRPKGTSGKAPARPTSATQAADELMRGFGFGPVAYPLPTPSGMATPPLDFNAIVRHATSDTRRPPTLGRALRLRAQLQAEQRRIQSHPHLIGSTISIGHAMNVHKGLQEVDDVIRRAKGLPPIDSYSGNPTAQERASAVAGAAEPSWLDRLQASMGEGPHGMTIAALGAALSSAAGGGSTYSPTQFGVDPTTDRYAASEKNVVPDLQAVVQSALAAPHDGMRAAASGISRGLGNGPVDPSIYRDDVPSRVADHVGEYGVYGVPVLGGVLGGLQGASLALGVANDGVRKTASGLVHGMNPWEARTPEEAVLRFVGLLGGAAHVAGLSPAIRGRAGIAVEGMRRGRPVDPEAVNAILRDAGREAQARGEGQASRGAGPQPGAQKQVGVLGKAAKAAVGASERAKGPKPAVIDPSRRGLPTDVGKLTEEQYRALLAKAPRPIQDVVKHHLASGDPASARATLEGWAKFQNVRQPAPAQTPGIQSITGVQPYVKFDPTQPDMVAAAAKAAMRPVAASLPWTGESHTSLVGLAKEWIKNRQARNTSSKPFEMETPALGGNVLFTAESIGKIGGKTDTGLRMVPLIPDLLKHAEFVRWETAKRGHPNMTVAWLVSRLETKEGAHNVYMVIRRGPNGDYYYDHAYLDQGPTGLNYGIAP